MSLAAPVAHDDFSFSGDTFSALASNGTVHRRATLPELRAHFDDAAASGKDDRTAHWYEAQLKHYGLKPSKVKGTAKMRLYDAVRVGGLEVPGDIREMEKGMQKEWTLYQRAEAAGKKRKADAEDGQASKRAKVVEKEKKVPAKEVIKKAAAPKTAVPKTASTSAPKAKTKAAAAPPPKKATATTTTTTTTDTTTSAAAAKTSTPRTKQTARRSGGVAGRPGRGGLQDSSTPAAENAAKAPRKQTARRSGGVSGRPGRGGLQGSPSSTKDAPTTAPRTKQTARRAGGSAGRAGRGASTAVVMAGSSSAPKIEHRDDMFSHSVPVKEEYPSQGGGYGNFNNQYGGQGGYHHHPNDGYDGHHDNRDDYYDDDDQSGLDHGHGRDNYGHHGSRDHYDSQDDYDDEEDEERNWGPPHSGSYTHESPPPPYTETGHWGDSDSESDY